jgi:hypothetical protein
MSFNHPEALALVQRFQEIEARRHFNGYEPQQYCEADTKVWGIFDDEYQMIQKEFVNIMRDEEQAVAAVVPVE